jgi:endo-1,4-beta-xylanase
MRLTRRRLAGAISWAVVPARGQGIGPSPALSRLAEARGLLFGFAIRAGRLLSDADYAAFVVRQADILVPENACKWESLHPQPDRYDFSRLDQVADFAAGHGLRLRGHNFCWHRALPDWVERITGPAAVRAVLEAHIATVAGRYAGRMHSWDVVNEPIQPTDGLPGGLRDTFWYRSLGPGYIDLAFAAARRADPKALLCINDYGLENDDGGGPARREAMLSLLRGMLARGVPVGGVGLQSHLRAGGADRFGPGLARFIGELAGLGLRVLITELDVDDSRLDGSDDEIDREVAGVYRRYLDLVLGTGAIEAVTSWGVWDNRHYTGATPPDGPPARRALVFGPEGEIKPASRAVAAALAAAPPAVRLQAGSVTTGASPR